MRLSRVSHLSVEVTLTTAEVLGMFGSGDTSAHPPFHEAIYPSTDWDGAA